MLFKDCERTDRRTDRQTDGGDNNIPDAFSKKRGDNNYRIPLTYLDLCTNITELHCELTACMSCDWNTSSTSALRVVQLSASWNRI